MDEGIRVPELLSPRRLQKFLRDNGLFARKGLGQNFLISEDVLRRIVAAGDVKPGDTVVEVGPGLGSLTWFLVEAGADVWAFEKDDNFIGHLQSVFAGKENFHLIKGDFLKQELSEHLPSGRPFKMIANIPYNITSPIVGKVLPEPDLTRMVVTVQKQVAERMASEYGLKTWGAFSLFCQFWADTERVFDISPGHFHPAPSVYSSVVRMDRHAPLLEGAYRETFFQIVKAVFASRRKTLRNSFKQTPFFSLEGDAADRVFAAAGLKPEVRGESLSMDQFIQLARLVTDGIG